MWNVCKNLFRWAWYTSAVFVIYSWNIRSFWTFMQNPTVTFIIYNYFKQKHCSSIPIPKMTYNDLLLSPVTYPTQLKCFDHMLPCPSEPCALNQSYLSMRRQLAFNKLIKLSVAMRRPYRQQVCVALNFVCRLYNYMYFLVFITFFTFFDF